MALRFRKSFKIAPGIRVNIGKNGVSSIGIGPRGASMSFGKKGKYVNVGIPGTGLSIRQRIDSNVTAREQQRLLREQKKLEKLERMQRALSKVTLSLKENGTLEIINAFGEPLSRSELKLMWEQKSDFIRDWLENEMNEINGDVELLENIYLDTPHPNSIIEYKAREFSEPKPQEPAIPPKPEIEKIKPLGFLAKFSKKKKEEYELKLKKAQEQYEKNLSIWKSKKSDLLSKYNKEFSEWKLRKDEFDNKEIYYTENYKTLLQNDTDFMEIVLENAFNSLSWPRETIVSYEIDNNGSLVWIDVDLPEIEDLPQKVATLAANGKKLNIKNKPKKQLQLEYAKHIHGIAFRLVGITFATLPKSEQIIISGYSQRLSKATGKINDEYLFSFKIDRAKFEEINFDSLDLVDPIESLDRFEHIKKMTATGIFKPIEPFSK